MNMDNICFGCFREKGPGVCPHCGFDENGEKPFLALPLGTILNGRYMAGKVLGVGGFGITYLGYDLTLEIKVAIKEYMPSGLATRHSDRYTVALTGQERDYKSGMDRFLDEARILAKLQNTPNIVSVQNYFKENNTAYFVMEYIEGMSLKEYLAQQGGKIGYEKALSILKPVMEALVQVHSMNLMHRDISPDNIYITEKGESKLLDFGAARFSIGEGKSVSVILKHGYAPEEQYSSHGNQGPWTDVYAMGVTFYRCVTGMLPPDSIERIHGDMTQSPAELGVRLPPWAEAAIMKAIAVKPQDRFQNMREFIDALMQTSTAQSTADTWKTAAVPGSEAIDTDKKAEGGGFIGLLKNNPLVRWLTVGGAALIIALAIILPIVLSSGSKKPAGDTSPSGGSTVVENPDISGGDQDTEPPADTSEPGDTAAGTVDLGVLNATIDLPEGYTASEDGLSFTSVEKSRVIVLNFVWQFGVPIYSVSDVENNKEACVEQGLENMGGMASYDILTAGPDQVDGRDAYQVFFDAYDTDGSGMTCLLEVVEGDNDYGCYIIFAAYEQDDDKALDELYPVISSLRVKGAIDISGNAVYEDSALDFKFMYDPTIVSGGTGKSSVQINGYDTQCLLLYPVSGSTDQYVEIENAPYAANAAEAMAVLDSIWSGAGVSTGEMQTVTFGGIEWQLKEFEYDSKNCGYAAADIGGRVFVAGYTCSDDANNDTVALIKLVMESVRPM